MLSKNDVLRSLVVKNSSYLFFYLNITSPLKVPTVRSVYFSLLPLITDVNPDLINGKRATPPIKKRCYFMCQYLSDDFIFSSILRRPFYQTTKVHNTKRLQKQNCQNELTFSVSLRERNKEGTNKKRGLRRLQLDSCLNRFPFNGNDIYGFPWNLYMPYFMKATYFQAL